MITPAHPQCQSQSCDQFSWKHTR